jgi:CHAD domain-containing protein
VNNRVGLNLDASPVMAVKADRISLRRGMSVAEGFATIVSACVCHFQSNQPLVIERRDVEALHQTRVALRRLRSAFSLFRTAVADEASRVIRGELRRFSGELGDARNLDVYLQRNLPRDLCRAIERRREEAYGEVITAMGSRRVRRLMTRLAACPAIGEWRGRPKAAKPLKRYLNRRIDRLWRKVEGADDVRVMSDEQRHRLRIRVKNLRYALEFADRLHAQGKRKKFGRAVKDLQEALGQLNDAVVARMLAIRHAWPIDPDTPNNEARTDLREAERALHRLRKIGPYWRAKVN